MKNDDIGRALNRELSGISLSPEARARIKRRASATYPRAHRGLTAVAAAAAIMLLALGCALGLRLTNRPDTPDTVAAHGGTGTSVPLPTPTPMPASDGAIKGMWVADGCDTFHLYQACIMYEYKNAYIESVEKDGKLDPCPVCLADCYWLDLDSGEYHSDLHCGNAGRVAPIHKDLVAPMGYTGCAVCAYETLPLENPEELGYEITPLPAADPEFSPDSPDSEGYAGAGINISGASDGNSHVYDGSASETLEKTFIKIDSGAEFIGKYDNFTLTMNSWAAKSYDDLASNWITTSNTAVYTGGDELSQSNIEDAGMDYCWCTETGEYIHSIGNCTGMANCFAALAGPACKNGAKQICPECGNGIGNVFYTDGGNYFHAYGDCSGMRDASQHTRREAYSAGKAPCPRCLAYESAHPID